MEKFRGTLVVEQINGKRGAFCVGTLHTSIGEFKVTTKELDQFEPGRYDGLFLVEELRTKTVNWRNGLFTYIQAFIAEGGLLIDAEDQAPPEPGPAQLEPDPIDEENGLASTGVMPAEPVQPDSSIKPAASRPNQQVQTTANAMTQGTQPDDETIFGVELYPLYANRHSPIALDPTVDRNLFRQQKDKLKAAGYRFVSTHQHWVLSEETTGGQHD
jgi:hypothetical protein